MAYREVEMWEVLNVLRRLGRGETQAAIARATGRSRKTIRRYARKARALGWVAGRDPVDEALALRVCARLRPGRPRTERGEASRLLEPHRERIQKWLEAGAGEKRGLQLTRVHGLLRREGVEVPYSTLHRYAVRHCGFGIRSAITVRVADVAPGELAEVDFGRLGLVPDPETGRRRTLWALIVTLVHSWHQYVHVTHQQTVEDVIGASRIHGTTRQRPLAVFESIERAALLPPERPRFDPPEWGQYKVHPDHCVRYGKALYTVPTRHIGKQVWVRGDSKLVRIYVGGELVKTHERQPEGGKSLDYADYPPERAPYAMRDADRVLREGHRRGEQIGQFLERLLAGPFPWAKLRQAQHILRLGTKYGWPRVEHACRRALAFDLIQSPRVEAILQAALEREPLPSSPPKGGTVVQASFRFARTGRHFNHHTQGDPNARTPSLAQEGAETPSPRRPDPDTARSDRLREEDEDV